MYNDIALQLRSSHQSNCQMLTGVQTHPAGGHQMLYFAASTISTRFLKTPTVVHAEREREREVNCNNVNEWCRCYLH